jgi:hypothetical protein
MRRITRARPSPAIIVAVVALVAALAGTAIAGPGAESSKITGAKVKKKATKVANQVVDQRLPITSAELGTINTREVSQTVPDSDYFEGTANCQTGEKVLSGGVKWDNNIFEEFTPIYESYKQGEGWYARVSNFSGNGPHVVHIEAYCLAA